MDLLLCFSMVLLNDWARKYIPEWLGLKRENAGL